MADPLTNVPQTKLHGWPIGELPTDVIPDIARLTSNDDDWAYFLQLRYPGAVPWKDWGGNYYVTFPEGNSADLQEGTYAFNASGVSQQDFATIWNNFMRNYGTGAAGAAAGAAVGGAGGGPVGAFLGGVLGGWGASALLEERISQIAEQSAGYQVPEPEGTPPLFLSENASSDTRTLLITQGLRDSILPYDESLHRQALDLMESLEGAEIPLSALGHFSNQLNAQLGQAAKQGDEPAAEFWRDIIDTWDVIVGNLTAEDLDDPFGNYTLEEAAAALERQQGLAPIPSKPDADDDSPQLDPPVFSTHDWGDASFSTDEPPQSNRPVFSVRNWDATFDDPGMSVQQLQPGGSLIGMPPPLPQPNPLKDVVPPLPRLRPEPFGPYTPEFTPPWTPRGTQSVSPDQSSYTPAGNANLLYASLVGAPVSSRAAPAQVIGDWGSGQLPGESEANRQSAPQQDMSGAREAEARIRAEKAAAQQRATQNDVLAEIASARSQIGVGGSGSLARDLDRLEDRVMNGSISPSSARAKLRSIIADAKRAEREEEKARAEAAAPANGKSVSAPPPDSLSTEEWIASRNEQVHGRGPRTSRRPARR